MREIEDRLRLSDIFNNEYEQNKTITENPARVHYADAHDFAARYWKHKILYADFFAGIWRRGWIIPRPFEQ